MPRFGPAAALALLLQPFAAPRPAFAAAEVLPGTWMDSSMGLLQGELTARYGPGQRLRIQRGLAQAARFWLPADGGADRFEDLVRAQFAGDPRALDALFGRLTAVLDGLDRHLAGIGRELAAPEDPAPPLPVEDLLEGLDPAVHLSEDGFRSQVAFAVLLNFPLTSLVERTRDGRGWSRRQWAEAWLAERFSRRVPAQVARSAAAARAGAERALADGRIRLDHVLAGGRRLWPSAPPGPRPGQLQDEIRAQYAQGRDGLARQRALQAVLERIVAGELPPDLGTDWDPALAPARAGDSPRYRALLASFQAARMLDPYAPLVPSQLRRSLEEGCQLPEARLRAMLETVSGSPLAPRVAQRLQARLGRKLEPFDLCYQGFRPTPWAAADLEALVRQADLPRVLPRLGRPQAGAQGEALDALGAFWSTWAACGAALVDLDVWHWLYAHPDATAEELRTAVPVCARAVWNRSYAPVLGGRDSALLAGGPELLTRTLGLPAIALGHLMAFQLLRPRGGEGDAALARGARLERMTPDLWLTAAAGGPVAAEPLLEATERALGPAGQK